MSPRGTRARRASMSKKAIWLAAGAVVLAGSGVTAMAVTGGSGSTGARDDSRPARAHTLALDGKDAKKRDLPRTETQLFSLVGVSWEDSADDFEGTAQIRTRSADSGTWTDWHDLDFDIRAPETDEGDASGVRGASEPLWVGPSDAVEARVVAGGKETAVPDALRLDMIDPGETKGGRGQGGGGGKGKSSARPGKTETADPSASAPDGDTPPSTAPAPTASSPEPTGTAPVTGEPTAPTASASSEAPTPVPTTGEPSSPAPSDEPTPQPTPPTGEPTATQSTQPPQESQQPTGEPSSPAPSDEPTPQPTPPTGEPTATQSTQPPTQEPAPAMSTAPTTPTVPAIVSRAEWGADESLVADPPSYLDKVDAVFVHHTAGTNDYDCAESPAIIRAILTYHVKTNGWNDIGYNFFVDKCGTVFEGRAGGTDKPVRGAHTYGFNGYSSGVSLLGNYEDGGTPTTAAKQAIADISAWKLGLHGVDPEAKVTLTAAGDTGVYKTGEQATLNTISGHRDGFATLCPGATLYSALPEIRRTAGASVFRG
ncbi:N-acetylmuramoyl-L-alanine amidase [Streptomyces sp. NPDC003023]|uniref:peptidoglycan recognition protein family protein n=1 Tax=Streptomyces sp. NPDC003023 TaxID=3364675 RepID=UPI00369F6122